MRRLVAFVLLLIGALLVPASTVAWWAHDAVVSADGYVETVAPLAKDPAVVAEVEDRLTTATTQRVADSTGAPAGQVRPLVRLAVQRAVADPAFGRVWRASNRDVHRQVVAVLRGRSTSAGPGSTVGVQLAPVSVTVREELVAAGIPFADRLPTVRSTLPLLPTDQLARARGGYAVLDAWGPVLPFVTALVVALGLLAARRRAGSLAWTALASLAGAGPRAARRWCPVASPSPRRCRGPCRRRWPGRSSTPSPRACGTTCWWSRSARGRCWWSRRWSQRRPARAVDPPPGSP